MRIDHRRRPCEISRPTCSGSQLSTIHSQLSPMPPRALAILAALAASGLAADEFPRPYNTEPENPSPISPEEALTKLTMPPGFNATIFAAEPEVQNPIAMCFDAKGRC